MSTLLWTSPRSSPSPMGHRPAHQIAFGASAFQHSTDNHDAGSVGSSSAGFGFGFGAGPSTSTSSGFGFASGTQPPIVRQGSAFGTLSSPQHGTVTASANKRRRRRSGSSGDDMDNGEDERFTPGGEGRELAGKRARTDLRAVKSMGVMQASAPTAAASSDIDLGKALASLSKPALLGVLTSLLAQQPSLKPAVFALLPPPSLESFIATLHSTERKVIEALPLGSNLRQEYVWSRIRAPLEDYIAEARLALSQFCPSPTSIAPSHEEAHPSATFTFLYTLTASIRKLEVLLPRAPTPFASPALATPSINNPSTLNPRDPLMSFLPSLFNQWHLLATRLSTLVNSNGRVLSAETVRGWFRHLDELVNIPVDSMHNVNNDVSNVGRKASEAVRERFIRELGWLVGIKTVQAQDQQQQQQQQQSLMFARMQSPSQQQQQGVQAVASQMMDSKMIDDDSDEEL